MNTTNHTSPSGEDAANGAIGDGDDTAKLLKLAEHLESGSSSIFSYASGEDYAQTLRRFIAARAALTAEKVAGQEPVAKMDAAKLIKQWIRDHESELNYIEFARIDASLDRLMMHLALAAPQQPAQSAEQDERAVGDVVDAWDAYASDRSNEQAATLFVLAMNRLREARAASTQSTATQPVQDERALTDEQREKIAEAHDCSLDGDHKAAREILMTLLAAQPESGGEA